MITKIQTLICPYVIPSHLESITRSQTHQSKIAFK